MIIPPSWYWAETRAQENQTCPGLGYTAGIGECGQMPPESPQLLIFFWLCSEWICGRESGSAARMGGLLGWTRPLTGIQHNHTISLCCTSGKVAGMCVSVCVQRFEGKEKRGGREVIESRQILCQRLTAGFKT